LTIKDCKGLNGFDDCCLQLIYDGETIYLRCSSPAEQKNWFKRMNDAIDNIKQAKSKTKIN
jgi:hypothetical protein